MTKPLMSDAEIRRRKKLQGATSRTTSTLGLTALGITAATTKGSTYKTAGKAVLKPVKSAKNATRALKAMKPEARRKAVRSSAVPIMSVSGGVGGIGGYNFASYTEAESRKRKQTVTKSDSISAFGVDHS